MRDERVRVLEMVQEGRITPEEAIDLLDALDAGARQEQTPQGRRMARDLHWLAIRVTDLQSGRLKTNLNIPIDVVRYGLSFARRWIPMPAHQIDELATAIQRGRRGTVFDVTDENDQQRVEIVVE